MLDYTPNTAFLSAVNNRKVYTSRRGFDGDLVLHGNGELYREHLAYGYINPCPEPDRNVPRFYATLTRKGAQHLFDKGQAVSASLLYQPMTMAERLEWTRWGGGDRPPKIPRDALIDLRLRNGEEILSDGLEGWKWMWDEDAPSSEDVVAWRRSLPKEEQP